MKNFSANEISNFPHKTTDFYDTTQLFFNNPKVRTKVLSKLDKNAAMPMSNLCFSKYKKLLIDGLLDTPEYLPLLNFIEYEFNKSVQESYMLTRKISPGIAYRPYPWPLHLQQIISINKLKYNANYAGPQGPAAAIQAVRLLEGACLDDCESYPEEGIFFVNGGSNGIFSIINFFKKYFPKKQRHCISCGPAYIQFLRNTEENNISIDIVSHEAVREKDAGIVRFLPTPEEIRKFVTPQTSSLIITQPNNPTGEFYTYDELKKIIEIAQENNLIIVDDAAFEELIFPEHKQSFFSLAQVASHMNELDRIVTIKSFSKGKNFPGSRVGMIITKNSQIIDFLPSYIHAQRDTHAILFNDIICLDSILRLIEIRYKESNKNLNNIIHEVVNMFEQKGLSKNINIPINEKIVKAYMLQREDDMDCYQKSFKEVQKSHLFKGISDTRAAYNTLVYLSDYPKNMPLLDFSFKLFEKMGVETEWSPNYGITHTIKDCKSQIELWMRVTFSSSPQYINDSFDRIKKFRDQINSNISPEFVTH